MSNENHPIPEGLPFSRLYRLRGVPAQDSKTFRVRVAEFVKCMPGGPWGTLISALALRGGISVPVMQHPSWSLAQFFQHAQIDEVLDSITYIHMALSLPGASSHAESRAQKEWREFVALAMREENLGHTLDSKCGVHYFVDEEFAISRSSTVAALEHPALASARLALDASFRHLDARPVGTKDAIKSIFEAVEILALHIVPGKDRLTKNLAVMSMPTACLPLFPAQATEQVVARAMFVSLGYWAEALQDYRHGKLEASAAGPSEELAVYALNTGCAHLRWLAPCAISIASSKEQHPASAGR